MIIVGERINTSRKKISEAVANRDIDFIVKAARDQAEAGADFIDVNAGTFLEEETDCLCWLVETVQAHVDLPLCLDSPSPGALSEAIKRHKGEPMINSISLEKDRYEALLPVITSQPCHVVALCMTQTSMPANVEERVQAASELIKRLTDKGVPIERIYVDPLVQPVSVDTSVGLSAVGAVKEIMQGFPGVNTIYGLSNVSFGLPQRSLINRNFLALAVANGLTAAIMDPTDRELISTLITVEMLLGRDEYCEKYIDAYQNGILTDR
jgi:5-methyltetrahydrofolate--homocysteine methyltransferase